MRRCNTVIAPGSMAAAVAGYCVVASLFPCPPGVFFRDFHADTELLSTLILFSQELNKIPISLKHFLPNLPVQLKAAYSSAVNLTGDSCVF